MILETRVRQGDDSDVESTHEAGFVWLLPLNPVERA